MLRRVLFIIAPIDVTTASSNSQAVTSQASEENVVGINLEDGKCNQLNADNDIPQLQVTVLILHHCCREG